MPKLTFLNIDSEKRQRIISVVIDEFAENTYETASINQIVKNSEIAKGSFYQYFEDKLDVYKMAIEISKDKRREYIEEVYQDSDYLDDFAIIRELCITIIEFEIEKPKYSSIINKFYKNTDIELKEDILEDIDIDIRIEFKKILEKGIDNGKIYHNIDIDFTSFLLENISRSTKEYFKMQRRENQYVNYKGFINNAVDLVENGIKAKKRSNIEDIF